MSRLFFKDKLIIGVDISQSSAKVMALGRDKHTVLGYGSVDLDPAKMQNVHDMSDHLKLRLRELLKGHMVGRLPSNHVILSVPTARTFTRSITLPKDAEDNLIDAIQLEAEQYIPVSLSELYIDYEVIEQNKDTTEVLMSAVPKLHADALMEVCADVGLRPVLIEPSIISVARVIRATEEGQLPTIILDISADATDIAILDKTIRVTGGINVGGHAMTQAIMKQLDVTHDAAHMLRTHNGLGVGPKQEAIRKAMTPSLNKIIAETKKVVRYYNERLEKKTKLEQLILVGGGSNVPGLGDYFTDNMVIAARTASPWQILDFGKLTPLSRQLKPRFITAIGLSLVNEKEIWK